MKTTLLALICFMTVTVAQAQEVSNYQLTINGKSVDIALGKEYRMKLPNGKEVTVAVTQKSVLTYQDEWVSLQYPKELHPAFATPDPDLEQMTLLTANGNGVLLQKYKTVNPVELVDLMVKEITNEELSFGYSKTEGPFEHQLVTGQKARGKSVVLRYGSNVQHYTVAALGGENEGIIFMTMLNTEQATEDDKVIQLFLDTLAYKRN